MHQSSQNGVAGKQAVFKKTLIDALSAPAIILLTTMIGWGTLARAAGFSAEMAVVATLLIWGLPGQVAMAELFMGGSGMIAAVLGCSLANARFLPMTVSFLPLVHTGVKSKRLLFLMGQMLSINSWAMCQRAFPSIAPDWRRYYYLCFATTILIAAVIGTLIGFYAANVLPTSLVVSLIFLSPLFFALVLAGNKNNGVIISMFLGVGLMLLLHSVMPDTDLLVSGFVAGTAGFLLSRSGLFKAVGK
ncbi:MAG: AzlC family ABC transporter permease [Arenicellales bacterium WSBS_2016_MAG_OTU3]